MLIHCEMQGQDSHFKICTFPCNQLLWVSVLDIESTNNTGLGRGRVGLTESHGDSPLCIVYIIPQHSTLFASEVETTLIVFYTLW